MIFKSYEAIIVRQLYKKNSRVIKYIFSDLFDIFGKLVNTMLYIYIYDFLNIYMYMVDTQERGVTPAQGAPLKGVQAYLGRRGPAQPRTLTLH